MMLPSSSGSARASASVCSTRAGRPTRSRCPAPTRWPRSAPPIRTWPPTPPPATSSASPAGWCSPATPASCASPPCRKATAPSLQAMISLAGVGAEALEAWKSDVDLGDIVFVRGEVISSRRGELSVLADSWQMAAKALRPLPVAHKEMSEEARVRQRYVDLIVRPQARAVARQRIAVVRAVRNGLERRGFLEVETPMLQTLAGGAAARPVRRPTPTRSTPTCTCGSRRNCSSSGAWWAGWTRYSNSIGCSATRAPTPPIRRNSRCSRPTRRGAPTTIRPSSPANSFRKSPTRRSGPAR